MAIPSAAGGAEVRCAACGRLFVVEAAAAQGTPRPRPSWLRHHWILLVVLVGTSVICGGALAVYFIWFYDPPPAPMLTLAVSTQPPGVEVFLDGRSIGTTTQPAPGTSHGRLTATVAPPDDPVVRLDFRKAGYRPQRRTETIESYAHTVGGVRLEPGPFTLTVMTEPPGADVTIDGKRAGTGPLTTELPHTADAPRTAKATKPGYHPASRQFVSPEPGRNASIELTLTPREPVLTFETTPAGAEVSVADRSAGRSPGTVTLPNELRGSRVSVRATLEGCEPATTQVAIPLDPVQPVSTALTLPIIPPTLRIGTDPSGGLVILNGRRLGTAPQTVPLTNDDRGKTYRIEALQDGDHVGRASVTVPDRIGQPEPMTVTMTFFADRTVWLIDRDERLQPVFKSLTAYLGERLRRMPAERRFHLIGLSNPLLAEFAPRGCVPATPENKVAGYDFLGKLTADNTTDPREGFRRAIACKPDAIWAYLGSTIHPHLPRQIADLNAEAGVRINVIAVEADAPTQDLMKTIAEQNGGIFRVLGADAMRKLAPATRPSE